MLEGLQPVVTIEARATSILVRSDDCRGASRAILLAYASMNLVRPSKVSGTRYA
jgi:hypothetical protein